MTEQSLDTKIEEYSERITLVSKDINVLREEVKRLEEAHGPHVWWKDYKPKDPLYIKKQEIGIKVSETFKTLGDMSRELTDFELEIESNDEREIVRSIYGRCRAKVAELLPYFKYWR